MVNIKLKAKTENEKILLAYLTDNASPDLAERINAGIKTLAQCWNYITSEARKLAVNGCACIQDSTVFGWAIHFFEEDEIKGDQYNKATAVTAKVAKAPEEGWPPAEETPEVTTAPKKKTKAAKPAAYNAEQFSFEDMFG